MVNWLNKWSQVVLSGLLYDKSLKKENLFKLPMIVDTILSEVINYARFLVNEWFVVGLGWSRIKKKSKHTMSSPDKVIHGSIFRQEMDLRDHTSDLGLRGFWSHSGLDT